MFSQAIADDVLAGLMEGKSLRSVCRELAVNESTVRGWERDHDEFSTHSLRAREIGGHAMADDCLDIADAGGDVQLAKLRIDTRLRLLGKWLPKLYGEKLETVHSGAVRFDGIESVIIDPEE